MPRRPAPSICARPTNRPRTAHKPLTSGVSSLTAGSQGLGAGQVVQAAANAQPVPRVVRQALPRPVLQGGHPGVLGHLFGQPEVTHATQHGGHDAGGLLPPDGAEPGLEICRQSRFS